MSSGTASSKGVGVRPRPCVVVAVATKLVVLDDVTDFWNETAGFRTVDGGNGFGDGAKPPCIGGETVGANRLAPGGIVITRVCRSILLFDDDPGVDGEYRLPSNRARPVNPDDCFGMLGWQRQQARG